MSEQNSEQSKPIALECALGADEYPYCRVCGAEESELLCLGHYANGVAWRCSVCANEFVW